MSVNIPLANGKSQKCFEKQHFLYRTQKKNVSTSDLTYFSMSALPTTPMYKQRSKTKILKNPQIALMSYDRRLIFKLLLYNPDSNQW